MFVINWHTHYITIKNFVNTFLIKNKKFFSFYLFFFLSWNIYKNKYNITPDGNTQNNKPPDGKIKIKYPTEKPIFNTHPTETAWKFTQLASAGSPRSQDKIKHRRVRRVSYIYHAFMLADVFPSVRQYLLYLANSFLIRPRETTKGVTRYCRPSGSTCYNGVAFQR